MRYLSTVHSGTAIRYLSTVHSGTAIRYFNTVLRMAPYAMSVPHFAPHHALSQYGSGKGAPYPSFSTEWMGGGAAYAISVPDIAKLTVRV
eukprot:1633980-Rhodomonas_salina.1